MSLKRDTIRGVWWALASRVSRQLLQFIVSVILARLLTPDDFGLVAMVLVFTNFIALFSELGLGAALIQKVSLEEKDRSSVFWLNVGMGVALTASLAALAPLVASFYREPRLEPLTRLISLCFIVGSLNSVQLALLRRRLEFRLLGIVTIAAVLLSGVLAVTLALFGYGAWSIAWQQVCFSALMVVFTWSRADWRPRLVFRFGAIRSLWRFGGNLVGFSVVNYWVRNADNLLIGRFLGSSSLGIYTRAYSTMLLPVSQITAVATQVMFPALSKIQDDIARVRHAFLRATRLIALLSFPVGFGLLVTARPFVLTLYGAKWEATIPIIQVLCLIAIKQPINAANGWIYTSLGRTDIQFKWGVLSAVVTIAAFVIGVQWGVIGVAVAYVIRGYLLELPAVYIPTRLIRLPLGAYYSNVAAPFLCAGVMALLVAGVGLLLPGGWPAGARLGVQVVVGIAAYVSMIHLFRLRVYQEFKAILFRTE